MRLDLLKLFADYGLLLVIFLVGLFGVLQLRKISRELKSLNNFLKSPEKQTTIPTFLRKG